MISTSIVLPDAQSPSGLVAREFQMTNNLSIILYQTSSRDKLELYRTRVLLREGRKPSVFVKRFTMADVSTLRLPSVGYSRSALRIKFGKYDLLSSVQWFLQAISKDVLTSIDRPIPFMQPRWDSALFLLPGGDDLVSIQGRVAEKGSVVHLQEMRLVEHQPERPSVQPSSKAIVNLELAGQQTALEVSKLYPERLRDAKHAMEILQLNSANFPHNDTGKAGKSSSYLADVSLGVLHHRLFAPVRHLINGKGKSWRSHLVNLTLSVLGADPMKCSPLMAAIELVHTGSLIIDDIQDESPTRRGVPAVHTVWGTATAINAGEAAYFSFHTAIQTIPDLSPGQKLGLLELFFEMMRLGHVGQALDIAGQQESVLYDVLEGRADPSALERSILAVHRLKTAVVAGYITRMASLLAGASRAQTEALAAHWENVGIAFQIMDDVYDIRRGLVLSAQRGGQINPKQSLKRPGDDIRSGKISIPLAKAGRMMPLSEARWVWETVLSKPGDDDVTTQKVIDKLEYYGVVDTCVAEARERVHGSWRHLDSHLPESPAKDSLFALSWFMAEYRAV